ncbi:MAG: class I SAM-dependent methyltransferase [Acidimicrobiales bacterium]|nr:class I SAM-dependent methyltransferase [Acidimicrobiales bacterium]
MTTIESCPRVPAADGPVLPVDEGLRPTVVELDGLRIAHDRRVLEPRPWTVRHGRWAASLSGSVPPGPILELCCGAGHIGLVAAVRTGRPLVQVDACPVACAYATHNARVNGVPTTVRHTTLAELGGWAAAPLVVADPPYLADEEVAGYPDDPVTAVAGGPDGLDVVRECLDAIDRVLLPGGRALLQLGGAHQVSHVGSIVPSGLVLLAARAFGPGRAVVKLARLDDVS